nr:hypothetical protein [Tanacetum cinerariifolium]
MNYIPVSAANQTKKDTGPQDTNGNSGTQDNVDAGKDVSNQHYIVLPLWSSISSTYKSSEDKSVNDKPKDGTGSKTVEESINTEDQAYRDELDRLMSQQKEASDAVNALIKDFEQGCMDQRGVTQAGSTNSFNTVSNPVNAASTSETFSAGGPSSPHPDAFIPANTLLHVKYVAEILKKFDFSFVKTASTPTETQKPLVKDEVAADIDVHLYRSMIGSLMYLMVSRPDIMFAVCSCYRFKVTPKLSHLQTVKRIFRKSTIRGCQFLGRRLISWQCKKQTIVATSTTEAEYVAAAHCCGLVLGFRIRC